MQYDLTKDVQLNVAIDVTATDYELKALEEAIKGWIGPDNPAPLISFSHQTKEGRRYNVAFSLEGPAYFDLNTIQDWFYSQVMVGWEISATTSPIDE